MIKKIIILVFIARLVSPIYVWADTLPVAVSIWHPLQVPSDLDDIFGFRVNVVYGVHHSVSGLDLGLINRSMGDQNGVQFGSVNLVNGTFRGVQMSDSVNIVKGDFVGWQNGFGNGTDASFTGLQTGVINGVRADLHGVQLGLFFNDVRGEAHGLQIGFINVAGSLHGVQVGVLNVNETNSPLGYFPVLNIGF